MNEEPSNPPISRKEYLDDPKHPLRLKPSAKRKPKKVDKQRVEEEKSNENFSLIEKMRKELESIVGPEQMASPNRNETRQSFTPMSPLEDSLSRQQQGNSPSRSKQINGSFINNSTLKNKVSTTGRGGGGGEDLLTYMRSNKQINTNIGDDNFNDDNNTMNTEVSGLTQTGQSQPSFIENSKQQYNHFEYNNNGVSNHQNFLDTARPNDMHNHTYMNESKKRQRPRSKGKYKEDEKKSTAQKFGKTDIPILPAFFEIETFRRELSQANDQIEADKQKLIKRSRNRRHRDENNTNNKKMLGGEKEKEVSFQKENNVKSDKEEYDDESVITHFSVMQKSSKPISAIPVSIPEGGSSGPGFYGVSFKRNPSRVPQSAIDFWSTHKDQAPIISSKGLGALSFDLPYQSEIHTTISNHTKDKNFYRYAPSTSSSSSSSSMMSMSQVVSAAVFQDEKAEMQQRAMTTSGVFDRKGGRSSDEEGRGTVVTDNETNNIGTSPTGSSGGMIGGSTTLRATTAAASYNPINHSVKSPLGYSQSRLNTGGSVGSLMNETHSEHGDELTSFVISLGSNPTTPITTSFRINTGELSSRRSGGGGGDDYMIQEEEQLSINSGSVVDGKRGVVLLNQDGFEESHNLWEDQFRSPLARSLDPSMLYLTRNATNTAHIEIPQHQTKDNNIDESKHQRLDQTIPSPAGSSSSHITNHYLYQQSVKNDNDYKDDNLDDDDDDDEFDVKNKKSNDGLLQSVCKESSEYEDDVGEELARAMLQSEAAIVGGPDFENVLLAAASYRNKSPRSELLEIDMARQAIKKGRLAHMGITNEYQISCQLFAWSAESHQAAWVIQRFIRKRQIRRNICQIIIKNAYYSYVERKEFLKAVQNAKKISGQLMPILRIYFLKISKKVKAQRKAAIFLQSNIRKWKAIKKVEAMKQQRYLNAAMLLTQTFHARLRYRKRKKRRDKIQLIMALKLQAWIRGRIARNEFRMMELCQKWFASIWRKFFEKKYGNAVYRIQQYGRRFILGLKARKIQCMSRIWLAKRRAKEKVIQATIAENLSFKGEHTYVIKGVRNALDGLAATYAGTGARNGISDKQTGKEAKKKLDQIVRIREKNIQARHKAAIHANEAEYKINLKKLKADGVLPDSKSKLRKEIRSLLYLGHQPLLTVKKGGKKGASTKKANSAGKKLSKDNNEADEDDVIDFDEKSNFGSLFCFYDGPMRSKPPPLSSTKKFNQTQISRHKRQNKFYEESINNMQRALSGEGYRKKVGCCDIHFLRIVVASFGCYDVTEDELLYVMHEFDPTSKELPKKKIENIELDDNKSKKGSSVNGSGGNESKIVNERDKLNDNIQEGEEEEDDETKKKSSGGFFSGLNNMFSRKKPTNPNEKSHKELFPIPFKSNVNSRGYVANDERLILGLSLLIHKHLYGENRPKGISGSAVGVSRQLQAAWGKVGRSVPVFEGSIGSMVTKSLLPQSMLYVHAAKYEHLRMVADMAFVKATEHYRIRYPAKWSCPLCLAAFPTWGMMNKHVRSKNCVRRAPTFNCDQSDESSQEMWDLITEKRVEKEKVNYFAKMKSSSSRKVGGAIFSIPPSSPNRKSMSNVNKSTTFTTGASGGGSSSSSSINGSQQISVSEVSATSAAQLEEAAAANLGGYWDPSGGLNKRGRQYASGIPPPEEQVLEL